MNVRNLTEVKEVKISEALNCVFEEWIYTSSARGGVTTEIATVQAIVGRSVSEGNIEKLANIVDDAVSDAAVEVTEQVIDNVDVELQIDRDAASDSPVTKSAKRAGEQQKRVVEIMEAVNEGKEIDIPALMDEIFPEQRIQ